MSRITISKEEFDILVSKAQKWDKLDNEISKFYCDVTGEVNDETPEKNGDLSDIGLEAAKAFGWL